MIKKGYMLSVISWENDGDNYNTVTIDGLEKDDVEFYLNFINIFKKLDLENRYDEGIEEEEAEQFKDEMNMIYENNFPEKYQKHIVDHECILLTSRKLLSCGEDFTTRVYDSHSIYFIPEDIKDISKDFTGSYL